MLLQRQPLHERPESLGFGAFGSNDEETQPSAGRVTLSQQGEGRQQQADILVAAMLCHGQQKGLSGQGWFRWSLFVAGIERNTLIDPSGFLRSNLRCVIPQASEGEVGTAYHGVGCPQALPQKQPVEQNSNVAKIKGFVIGIKIV